jgi:uncharacterized protein YxeA
MRNTILLLITIIVTMIGLTACAAVFTDASDSNHVTFINSADESLAQLTEKANSYCQQYGKKAFYRKGDNLLVAVFDCR